MKNSLLLLLAITYLLGSSACSSKLRCEKHYTYNARKVDIKGITTSLKKQGVEVADIGIGEITIDPKYVTASDKLQELDLLQYALCGQIKGVSKKSPLREKLVGQYSDALLNMMKVAQNPEKPNP
jgi:hypothetical protein